LSRSQKTVLYGFLLLSLGTVARMGSKRAWKGFIEYETPFGAPPREPSEAGPALSRRVVVLLLDGLSHEASLRMPFLNTLRQKGADYLCTVGLPSLSNPGRAALFSGARQEVHGQMTNFDVRPLLVDTLFSEARRSGRKTGLVGTPSTLTLIGRPPDRVFGLGDKEPAADFHLLEAEIKKAEEGAASLVSGDLSFLFVEFNITDDAGHLWGGGSEEYRRAARLADAALEALVPRLDLSKDTLVVTADHGHTASGGHGGPEREVVEVPLVLVGAGIRPGVSGEARQIDVAPTVAALLGIPIPAANQGSLLLGEADPSILHPLCLQRERFVEVYEARLEGPGGNTPRCGTGHDTGSLRALDAAEAGIKARLEHQERWVRGGIVLLTSALLAILLAFLGLRESPGISRAAVFGLLGGLGYYALLPLAGISYSLSAVNKDAGLDRYFEKDMALAVCLCALIVVLSSERRPTPLLERARTAWVAEGMFLLPILLKIALVYWLCGVFLRWELPNPYWGFGLYLDVLAILAVSLATPLLPLLAWLRGRAMWAGQDG
jgi:hypothetical protein